MNRRAAPRVFTPHNPMAKILADQAGPTFEDLVQASTQRVAAMESRLDAYIEEQIGIIVRTMNQPETDVFADRHAVTGAAMRLAEVAGATRPSPLRAIAKGIAVLMNHLDGSGLWRPDVLRIHVAALKLAAEPAPPAEIELLFRELVRMRAGLGIVE